MTNHTVIRPGAGRYPLWMAIGALPLAVALACAGAAQADPDGSDGGQPGSTTMADSDGGQPGSTTSPAAPAPAYQAAPAPAAASPKSVAPRIRYVPTAPQTQAAVPRLPDGSAPMPPGMIRIGYLTTPAPEWIPSGTRDRINTAAAGARAQIGGAMRAAGVPSGRAEHIADATTTGAAAGFAAGAVPGAVVSGLAGGVIGALVGAVAGLPVLVVGAVPGLLLGAAAGTVAGAALGGTVTGTALGVVPGAVIGAAAGPITL